MKKIYRLLAIATAFGAVLAGCSQAEEDVATENREIKFSASVGTFQLKATDTAFEQGDAIGLFADNPVGVWNAKLTFSNGKLAPEEPIYWGSSQLLEEPVYFYAYYPYDADRPDFSWYHTVAADQSTHEAFTASDFMVARAQSAPADGAVQLNFVHAYSKLVFTVENLVDNVAVESVSVGRVRLEAFTYPGDVTGCWATEGDLGEVKAASVTNAAGEAAWAVIIPAQNAEPVVVVTLADGRQYPFNTEDYVQFNPSLRYNAKIVIDGKTSSTDFSSDITDWIDNGDITFGQFTDVGDWYCCNGNYISWMSHNGASVRYFNIAYYEGESFYFCDSEGKSLYLSPELPSGVIEEGVHYQLVERGINISLPCEGFWYLELSPATGDFVAYFTSAFPEPDNWGICGTIEGTYWDTDIPMIPNEQNQDEYSATIIYHQGEEFKFRKDGQWEEDYGLNIDGPALNNYWYELAWKGPNIQLESDGEWLIVANFKQQYFYSYRLGNIPGGSGYELDDIQPIVDSEDNTSVSLTQVVYAVTTNGFILFDGKYAIFVYSRSDSGLSVGDVVTVSGTKTTYNGVPEITGPSIELIDSNYADMIDLTYMCQDITSQLDNFNAQMAVPIEFEGELIDDKNMTVEGSNIKGCVYYAPASFGLANLTNHLIRVQGFYNGRYNNQLYIIATSVVDLGEVEHEQGDETPFDSNVTWTLGDNSNGSITLNVTQGKNTYENVKNVKLGTSSKAGTVLIDLPAGTSEVSFWALGWNGKNGALVWTVGDTKYEFSAQANTGVAGNGPFNVTVTEDDHYFLTFDSPLSSDTRVTLATNNSGYRAVIFGVVAHK